MVFSSLEFLFVFIPVVFAVYYLVPAKFRNICLLIGSIAFYVYGTLEQPLYIRLFLPCLLIGSIALYYVFDMLNLPRYICLFLPCLLIGGIAFFVYAALDLPTYTLLSLFCLFIGGMAFYVCSMSNQPLYILLFLPCLLIGGIAFFVYGTLEQPLYILLFLLSSVVNWFVGLRIARSEKHRKFWLITGLVYDFSWLFIFKYAGFFFRTAQSVLDRVWPLSGIDLPAVDLLLPIGISFYTFQIVSYLIDVYRDTVPAERSLIRLATYLYMFPQLIAGPIVTYSQVGEQLYHRDLSPSRTNDGLKEFTIGLGLKVLLANRIGNLWTDVSDIGFDSISTPLAWMGMIAFALQIYFDFYGYSLMAIGLGKMLGFNFPDNFRHPYMALSMTDFWRRWHITLGSWFRDYLYIPLGGNRVSVPRHIVNMLIVWLFTGFWHGANWNFLLWGFIFFVLLVLEKYAIKSTLERYPVLGHGYMFLLIPLTFLVFAITDLRELGVYFERLFPFLPGEPINVFAGDWLKYGKAYGLLILVGLVFCTKWPRRLYERMKDSIWGTLILLGIFWGSVYYLYLGLNDPFLYFRF